MPNFVEVFIDDENKPTNIPRYETIIRQSIALRPDQATDINTSGVRLTLSKTSDTDVSDIWVKFGEEISMGEAMTQRFVAQHLESNQIAAVRAPRVYLAFTWGHDGFIVTEYIDGKMCDDSDIPLVVAAVQYLITIQSPSPTPGRIGGGLIEHPFFIERTASVWYDSVKELQAHINGILRCTGRSLRVDFSPELEGQSLPLCVSDLVLVNFMKDSDGKIVAVDFGGYSFLPRSFFGFALDPPQGGRSLLRERLIKILCYQRSATVSALVSASLALIPYMNNNVGLPKELRSRINGPHTPSLV
ncbi:hypothetical protein FA95DRAFT_1519424 [Auriscalpium vulgare]|uniref:Uncharacterized protein n=1 Tax=Auriscalpium vulgare TaxID=40419 RepID=A0ACB8RT83_9AGAM|nr:hypothetical protein FA95DRAFT_1519424 [Auriscalpium vulgare]